MCFDFYTPIMISYLQLKRGIQKSNHSFLFNVDWIQVYWKPEELIQAPMPPFLGYTIAQHGEMVDSCKAENPIVPRWIKLHSILITPFLCVIIFFIILNTKDKSIYKLINIMKTPKYK